MVTLVRCLVDWRSISTTSGGQSVIMDLNELRQRGLANNLGFWEIFIMGTLGIFSELAIVNCGCLVGRPCIFYNTEGVL